MTDVRHHLRIAAPHVPFGPHGVPELLADADYLDSAARNLTGGYSVGGYNVTMTVINLLHAVAAEMRAEHERTALTGNGGRFSGTLAEIGAEAERSIQKHGEQLHLPMGTGPETHPLVVGVASSGPFRVTGAAILADVFTRDTKAHSFNEGGDGTVTWWHILREEVFEAAAEEDAGLLRSELVQVAAVALKMIDALDAKPSQTMEGA